MPVTLPPPPDAALMLDLDGTLLDIAATPDAVRVAPGLAAALGRLRDTLGGALAVVTGRPIEQVDALLPGVPYAVAGEHGGAIRHAPGLPVVRALLPDPPAGWAVAAARIVSRRIRGRCWSRSSGGSCCITGRGRRWGRHCGRRWLR